MCVAIVAPIQRPTGRQIRTGERWHHHHHCRRALVGNCYQCRIAPYDDCVPKAPPALRWKDRRRWYYDRYRCCFLDAAPAYYYRYHFQH